MVFFLAERGDKTQLATMALGARYHSHGPRLRLIAALLFFAFGLTAITASLGLF